VNRGAIFLDDHDRYHFRRLLRDACRKHAIQVHAFVLMDNHFHLLLTSPLPGALSRAIRSVGQSYVQAFNYRHARCGALWQGRFKSCLVETQRYLLTVMRYIELNPVRAAITASAQDYRWSSVHTHLGLASDPLITPHPLYLALGSTPDERCKAYRVWLEEGVADDDILRIRQHINQERALGDGRFQHMVEETLGRPATCRPRGRPTMKGGI
jgi:putative transposase